MLGVRCKCREVTGVITSMGMADCDGCEKCKTTLASHSGGHRELQPHAFIIRYNQITGKPYRKCGKCHYLDVKSYRESQKTA